MNLLLGEKKLLSTLHFIFQSRCIVSNQLYFWIVFFFYKYFVSNKGFLLALHHGSEKCVENQLA